MITQKKYDVYPLWIVFCLGFSSGLPMGLLTGALQAWFADQGFSLGTIGILSLMGLPYAYRFVWAPLVDRFFYHGLGRRRSWILLMQCLLWVGLSGLSMLTPGPSTGWICVLCFFLSMCSATQDIAIDAHRIEFLSLEYHGLGASCAIIGYRIALLLGAGGTLIVAHAMGWPIAYRMMSCFMIVGMLAVLYSKEPLVKEISKTGTCMQSFKVLWSQLPFFALVFLILTYKWGEAFTSTNSAVMIPFLLQVLGVSLDTLAYINKGLGLFASVLGGLLAGFILLRYPLSWVLKVCGFLQAINVLWFMVLSHTGYHLGLLCSAVFFENLCSGMGTVALVALLMRIVNQPYTATQFSILVAISSLPRLFAGSIAAGMVPIIGWTGLFGVTGLIALFYFPCLRRVIRHL